MTKTRFDFAIRNESTESAEQLLPGALMKRLRARIARRPGRWRRRMHTKTNRAQGHENEYPAAA